MTYDGADHYVLLFGGSGATGMLNDTWKFANGHWTKLHPASAPSPRRNPSLAYDPALGEVVLFGGADPNAGMSDTWTFHAGVWKLLSPTTSPPARTGAGFVYDPSSSSLILFSGTSNYCCSNAGIQDMWSFNGSWSQLTPTLPPQRNAFGFTYDSTLGGAVMFGGWQPGGGCGGPLNDTWVYSGGNWSQGSTPSGLVAVQGPTLAYDPVLKQDLLFGGGTGTCGVSGTVLGNTWAYSSGGWKNVSTSYGPAPQQYPVMTFDAHDGYIVFLGTNLRGSQSATWIYL